MSESNLMYQGHNLEQLAKMALEKPSDFGWWGFDEMFVTWGWAGIDKHNSSDLLQVSNFDVITKDMMLHFPDDVRIVGVSHWAVGHADRLTVRILNNESDGIVEDNIAESFKAIVQWLAALEDYPVADESAYSDLCYEEAIAAIRNNMNDMIRHENDSAEETAGMIAQEMMDNEHIFGYLDMFDPEGVYIEESQVTLAAFRLKLIDPDYADDWDEFCDTMGLTRIDWEFPQSYSPEIEGQLSIYDALGDSK